jgi:hypothetical protein
MREILPYGCDNLCQGFGGVESDEALWLGRSDTLG